MDSSSTESQGSGPHAQSNVQFVQRRSESPPRPSYSPFTPTLGHADLDSDGSFSLPPSEDHPATGPSWVEKPAADLDDNPDAIALQAAISILQSQRQQSLQDIKTLNKMKHAAKDDPEAFRNSFMKKYDKPNALQLENMTGVDPAGRGDDIARLPMPQNIIRCPPIEWKKYHIVGEPLDRMHEQQRKRPGSRDGGAGTNTPDHVVAKPYDPFTDNKEDAPNST